MSNIVEKALAARTVKEAEAVQKLIARIIGARHQRPLGDRWNNQGILTGSGSSYDHKALEVVTNMQDAVLERYALQKYGSRAAVQFSTPQAAAASLLADLGPKQQADLATVTIDRAEAGTNKKCITLVMRDRGCGITDAEVPNGIFWLGAKHKDGIDWQQGTFGLGGATTYLNAKAVVLISRRHPDLLVSGQADKITVAVVQWERERTTTNAYYLVSRHWDENDPRSWAAATPLSVPASDFPDFEAGTHLALIAYDTKGLGQRSGSEKSFDTVFNTRLFQPVLPIRYRNNITGAYRPNTLRGLARRLLDNPGDDRTEGEETLPFNHRGTTYHLPILFWLFAKPGEKGGRRNFVAQGHALLITSNGQVHSHWTPRDFKLRTTLNKLYDRILVVVETDALPIRIRTELFTADRAQFVQSEVAMRLEKEIAAFLDTCRELQDANKALIREAITGDNNDRPTRAIAEQIARSIKAKGFSRRPAGTGTGVRRSPKLPDTIAPEDLHDNPTHFEGPESVQALLSEVTSVYLKLNATDDFIPRRAQLKVTCDHPDIGASEITVGNLHSGSVRVAIAVPENADLGTYKLTAEIPEWAKTSGGLGPRFEWTTKVEVVEEIKPRLSGSKSGSSQGKLGPRKYGIPALVWKSETDDGMDDWDASTVGHVEMVQGRDLAEKMDEYAELSEVDSEVSTIFLNRTYSPLKSYVQARAAELTNEGKEKARDRYAVGAGVALLMLDQEERKAKKAGKQFDDALVALALQAAARAVLSVLPAYDRLARELKN